MVSQALRAILGSALRVVLVLLLLVTLLPAVSMVRTAAAETEGASANANATTNANANTDASATAETEAQTKELGSAVGSFWTLAWERSWPFIKGVVLKFWTALAAVFNQVRGSVEVDSNANVSGVNLVNVNGSIEVQ